MLTKSDYLNFLACPNEFWMSKNIELPARELSLGDTHLRQQGYDVENLSRQMAIFTPSEDRSVSFAKIFTNDELYAKADIVVTNLRDGSIEIYEVKSNASVKPEHIEDVAFQKYVVELLKYQISKVYVITVNTEYVRNGGINADQC
ncbi:MAG: hypothetical protein ABI999_08550, partial [Acidobacteriota bacterium]